METFSVKASKPNKCDSDNENNIHFLILPAIDVYGKRKCKITFLDPLNHRETNTI
nr:9131_t:CDS:2 [Entrophospora candida]